MEEFKDVSTIDSREELTSIWNYWVNKGKLLQSNSDLIIQEQKKNIDAYLDELNLRDKYLRSKIAKERAAARQAKKEQEERERQEIIAQNIKAVEEDRLLKEKIRKEISYLKEQIKLIEEEGMRYCIELGLYKHIDKIKLLEKELTKPLKSSCLHNNSKKRKQSSYSYSKDGSESVTHYYICEDCSYCWEQNW